MGWLCLLALALLAVGFPYVKMLMKRTLLMLRLRKFCKTHGYTCRGTHFLWWLGRRGGKMADFTLETPAKIYAVKLFSAVSYQRILCFSGEEYFMKIPHIRPTAFGGGVRIYTESKRKTLPSWDAPTVDSRGERAVEKVLLIHPSCHELCLILASGRASLLHEGDVLQGMTLHSLSAWLKALDQTNTTV